MSDLVVFLLVAAMAASVGVAFGIVVVAPRLTRHAERSDEEPGVGSD